MTQLTFGSNQAKEQLEKDTNFNMGLDRDKMRERLLGDIVAHENSPFVDFAIDHGLFVSGDEMADFVSEFLGYDDGEEQLAWIFEFLKHFVADMEDLNNKKLHKIAAILFDKTEGNNVQLTNTRYKW